MREFVIVGASAGGLALGIRLLNKGYKVKILEKNNVVGGKTAFKNLGGYEFDLTASVLMTEDSYLDVFKECNKDYKKYFSIQNIENMYKVFYAQGQKINIYNDINNTLKELEEVQRGLGEEYFRFIIKTLDKYKVIKNFFLDKPLLNLGSSFAVKNISKYAFLKPFESSESYINKFITNERLREYLLFTAMYIGINPYTNTSLYTLIPSISQVYGVFYIKGGVYTYIKALESLYLELGGKIALNEEVISIKREKLKWKILTKKKEYLTYDVVICADYCYATQKLLKIEKEKNWKYIDKKTYSCSVFILYLVLDKVYEQLEVHNIYINQDFKDSIESAFKEKIPEKMSLYIYNKTKIDTIENKTLLNIMLRVPNLSGDEFVWNERLAEEVEEKILETIECIKGLEDIRMHIEYKDYMTPEDLENKFNCYQGCAFGLAHTLRQSGCLRPHLKSKKYKGLYFLNASTHPGNGLSVVLDGSKVLENIICNDDDN